MWLEFHYRIRSMDRNPCSDVKFVCFSVKGFGNNSPVFYNISRLGVCTSTHFYNFID
jgi:hypothetical protein